MRPRRKALPRNFVLGRIRHDQDLHSGNPLANFGQYADALAAHDRRREQHQVRLPFGRLGEGELQCGELMRLVFIMQHELQGGPNDLVVVDDEDALVFNGPGRFYADLHGMLSSLFTLSKGANYVPNGGRAGAFAAPPASRASLPALFSLLRTPTCLHPNMDKNVGFETTVGKVGDFRFFVLKTY